MGDCPVHSHLKLPACQGLYAVLIPRELCSRADVGCSQAQSMLKRIQELLSRAFIILVEVMYCLWIMVGLLLMR